MTNGCSFARGENDDVIFEAFEVSALSEKVLAAKSALLWDFPGSATAVPYFEFQKPSFQDNLADFLEQASTESIKRFAAHTRKAATSAFESRDTVNPCLITEMLMSLLEAIGRRISAPLTRKRVHDDVCWAHGAEKPWRRCPYWLLLRVGIQRHMCVLDGAEAGTLQYKILLCLMLGRLIDDAIGCLGPELLAFLRAKLARRLVKLELDIDSASSTTRLIWEATFSSLRNLFHETLQKADKYVEMKWDKHKIKIRRPIPILPQYANIEDLILTLPNSRSYLQKVLSSSIYVDSEPRLFSQNWQSMGYDVLPGTAKNFRAFADHYFSLSELETHVQASHADPSDSDIDNENRCTQLAERIEKYLNTVADAYDNNPEQKSIMLLTVMDLWVSMDQCATKLFGLLLDYNPGIPLQIMGVLQPLCFADMSRLQRIERHIKDRYATCKNSQNTIYLDPSDGCFAERYFDTSPLLQELHQKINTAADTKRKEKEEEWQTLSAEFEELQKSIDSRTCVLMMGNHGMMVHDDRHCTKCYLRRKVRRMKIHVHEHPLPAHPIQMKAVVFELACPSALRAYRNATWMILGKLAHPKLMQGTQPKLLLRDYSELQAFMDSTMDGISLASTSKSFLSTHYSHFAFLSGSITSAWQMG